MYNSNSNALGGSKRILICGMDGYLGWPLAQHLAERGHLVGGIDNLLRRRIVAEVGSTSAIPIMDIEERLDGFSRRFHYRPYFKVGDLAEKGTAASVLEDFKPDAVVHLAEIPSAPYSMIDVDHAVFTHQNNVSGTLQLVYAMRDLCPDAHLLKLGTLGEYGTPPLDIPEGFFEVTWRGKTATVAFPRQPGSMYHLTKVHDTAIIDFACRIWGMRSTDVMQGVVFGTRMESMTDDLSMSTRFDFDEAFGTVINRYCAQAVAGIDLSPYGNGSQTRGFLPLTDSIQCFTLALEHPPAPGEYRVFNQFAEYRSVLDLAEAVQRIAGESDLNVTITPVENPRIEAENHHYNPDHQKLFDLGYSPTGDIDGCIRDAISDLLPHKERILAHRDAAVPSITWAASK